MTSVGTRLIPIKKRILVRKCTTGERRGNAFFLGDVAIPDASAEACSWAEVIDVASDCKLFDQSAIGGFVYLPAWKPGYINRVEGEDFVVKESLFTMPPTQGGAHPMIYR